jgi:diaminohydroxyphosphoribosylaminopyrimidine deaminase/5-amino-6-(5-phosphoribosylamino)uracil reductase
VVSGDGRVEEGLPGGHGMSVFAVPAGVELTQGPAATLTRLASGGVRALLLNGGTDLAEPFMAARVIDRIVVYVAPRGSSARMSRSPTAATDDFELTGIGRTGLRVRMEYG